MTAIEPERNIRRCDTVLSVRRDWMKFPVSTSVKGSHLLQILIRKLTRLIFVSVLCLWTSFPASGQQTASGNGAIEAEDLPVEAREAVKEFQSQTSKIREDAEKEIASRRQRAIRDLDQLQAKLSQENKTDQAIAIREKIRHLRIAHLKTSPNPGNLSRYGSQIGQTFYFDVIGKANGTAWGTDVYTSDSSLAAAAVHAGVLKEGQRGVVRVTIVKSPESFQGTERNGIRTLDFGSYPVSYKVRRPLPSDTNESGPKTESDPALPAVPLP